MKKAVRKPRIKDPFRRRHFKRDCALTKAIADGYKDKKFQIELTTSQISYLRLLTSDKLSELEFKVFCINRDAATKKSRTAKAHAKLANQCLASIQQLLESLYPDSGMGLFE